MARKQKIAVQIELDLSSAAFNVRVFNMNPRKGFIDLSQLRERLKDVMFFMQQEGIDQVLSELQSEQAH